MTNKTRIIVIGGGYAGIMTSLRIVGKTKRAERTVTLINAVDHFVERPRLHEQATGTNLKGKPIRDMIKGHDIEFVCGWVEKIQPEKSTIMVATEEGKAEYPYDILVNALGSHVEQQRVPGVGEFAYTLDPYGRLTAKDLETRLLTLEKRPFSAIVVGGGATGVETVTQIKSHYPNCKATIISQQKVGDFKDDKVQKHISEALHEQNIEVIENTAVLQVVADGVILKSGKIKADVVIWAGGFVASPLAKEAGLPVNHVQQTIVDPFLRSVSHPNIYAVGDAASPAEEPGAPMRMSLFAALVSGAHAADTIAAQLKGKEPQPFSFAWYGQGIALGQADAVGFATYPVDARSGPIVRGKTAVYIRNFFVWYLKFALELERRFPGFLFWNGKKRYAKQQKESIHAQQF